MSIKFDKSRWESIKENSTRWWNGELDRPLIHAQLHGVDPGRPEPALPKHGFAAFYDASVSADDIVDRWDYDLACNEYPGDSFPCVWPNFGAGVVAALLGARLELGEETCWFHSPADLEVKDLRFSYDPENYWYKRISDVYRAAVERWQGSVQVSMTDLGGSVDVLASFRPGEKLLFDLYDYPEDVKKRIWEIHEFWWRYFQEFDEKSGPNPGYTAWTPIFSETPYYMLQCDFCYMISPEMFDEFVKPELQAMCRKLTNPFYHLDGPGQLPHLDSLLSIPELKGVQWIPGDGQKGMKEWPEVYRKIRDAGKLIQLFGGIDILDAVADQVGSAKGIILISGGKVSDRAEFESALSRYGAG